MKITVGQLRNIIKEEVARVMSESASLQGKPVAQQYLQRLYRWCINDNRYSQEKKRFIFTVKEDVLKSSLEFWEAVCSGVKEILEGTKDKNTVSRELGSKLDVNASFLKNEYLQPLLEDAASCEVTTEEFEKMVRDEADRRDQALEAQIAAGPVKRELYSDPTKDPRFTWGT